MSGDICAVANEQVYRTYASQIIQAEVREYLSKLSISEIASSNKKINADLRIPLGKAIESLTPFSVRIVGLSIQRSLLTPNRLPLSAAKPFRKRKPS